MYLYQFFHLTMSDSTVCRISNNAKAHKIVVFVEGKIIWDGYLYSYFAKWQPQKHKSH